MSMKTMVLLASLIFLLISTIFNPIVYALEERKVLSRNYVGIGVEVYALYQCYSGENITVRVRVEALEDVRNASVTLFIWGSKSEGYSPWGTSFAVLEVTDFPIGTINEKTYNITIPSDIDPGLTYGILFLDWTIYRPPSWEPQWDKASFRATYVRNRNYENLQSKYQSAVNDLQNTRTLMYILLAAITILVFSVVYFTRKKAR